MTETVKTDIVIIGGGIAGLWLLNRLRQSGFSTLLLESDSLGGGQTHKAQGIIHGGMKYALQGNKTMASQAIADMPSIWEACLQGQGEIDLSKVPILSNQQCLWSTGSFTSKMAGLLAKFALKSDTHSLDKTRVPPLFQHPQFHGQVYSLNETVVDVHALLFELAMPHQDSIFKIDPMQENQLEVDEKDRLTSLIIHTSPAKTVRINAQKYIFTAGAGNELLLKKLKQKIDTQRRSLHMVIVKHDLDYLVYGHCVSVSATPRLTITTHRAQDSKTIWYLGGQLAEAGVKRNSEEQIQAAKKELHDLFPWLDFSKATFASFYVDRAENLQPDGKRPDSCCLTEIQNSIVAWPTKLAFAPLLAYQIMECLANIKPSGEDVHALQGWPKPAIAKPIWDTLLP